MAIIKHHSELKSLRHACQLAGSIVRELCEFAKPGVSTLEIEALALNLLQQNRSSAPFRQFDGFGHATCISINDEIVNAPPTRERILKSGDLVSIALGTEIKGIHGKAAHTVYLGSSCPEDIRRLLTATQEVLDSLDSKFKSELTEYQEISKIPLKSLLGKVPEIAARHQVQIIEDTGGSAIGKKLHEAPDIPNDPDEISDNIFLSEGLVLCVMPMFTLGESRKYKLHEDGWTYLTEDGAFSAHMAACFRITPEGLENLTQVSKPVLNGTSAL
ncbi:MAG: M24 family metallopeptidase [Cyanobacteria bacterium]|nr:M24 family metallopeptidase [Cyanobacteriota bacterium]